MKDVTRREMLKLTSTLVAAAAMRDLLSPTVVAAKKPKKRDWIMVGTGSDIEIRCFPSPAARQTAEQLWEGEFTPWHPEALATATSQIQASLNTAAQTAKHPGQKPSFIEFDGKLFLVWARDVAEQSRGGIGPDDDYDRVVKALRIQAKPKRPRPPEEPKKYKWVFRPKGTVDCFSSAEGSCFVTGLWRAAETSPWHTADLARATSEMQFILDRTARTNEDKRRHLSLLLFDYRLFLAWSYPTSERPSGGVDADDDVESVAAALRLKP